MVAGHLSDLLCAATPGNVLNLAREGINGDHVVLTGNPIVETVHAPLPLPPTMDRPGFDRYMCASRVLAGRTCYNQPGYPHNSPERDNRIESRRGGLVHHSSTAIAAVIL